MKRLTAALLIAAAVLTANARVPQHATATALDSAVAVFVASNIKLSVENALASLATTGVDVDNDLVKAMILADLAQPYDGVAHERANAAIDAAMAARAAEASEIMLAEAAAREGALVQPDGLVVETVTEGTGAYPTADDVVAMRYTGMLPDGTIFDAIATDEEPLITRVGDLCPGVTEGLMLMRAGSAARLTMPAALGYGTQGVPGVIPPDCALQFDVQLLDIQK